MGEAVASPPEIIYCGRGNKRLDGIAVELGMSYGVRLPHTVHFPLDFADQDWIKPDRIRYMKALEKHRPRWATVLDLERPDQLNEVMDWATEAAEHVTEGVVVIPKYRGAVNKIPSTIGSKQVRLGYSVPTGYGATYIAKQELWGRPVHLLGGQPHHQYYLAHELDVVSLDCNYTTRKAIEFGEFYNGEIRNGRRKWTALRRLGIPPQADSYLLAFAFSCMAILKLWQRSVDFAVPLQQSIF